MYIDFDELPNDARLWIYQASRELTSEEIAEAKTLLRNFVDGWQAHQVSLQASFQLAHERFLIIGVNTAHHPPSGCSIDASVAIVRQLEQKFNISFFERMQIPFRLNQKIDVVPMSQIKQEVAAGRITPDTLTFNNLIDKKEALAHQWEVPAKETWLARYF